MIKRNRIKWIVKKAVMHEDYTIHLCFADQSHRVYDMKPLLEKGIFSALKDQDLFLSGRLENGTVVWNEELDIAPEELYYHGVITKSKTRK